jgi:hypothetical protein
MPEWIVRRVWNSRVESHPLDLPALSRANCLRQGDGIEVRKGIAERSFCTVKEVLTVEEGDSSDNLGKLGHAARVAELRPKNQ